MTRFLTLAAALMAVAAPSAGLAAESLLARAVSCQVDDGDLVTLMGALAAEDAGLKTAAQTFAAPSGDLYRLARPVGALGYATDAIYVSPGRIVMVVSGEALAAVSARLQLEAEPYGPAERRIDDTRKIVAYQLSQGALNGKVLVGCEYGNPAAAAWLGDDMAGF
ncbi:hypothetical protein [Caulobacter sp. BK020]|uniref:hypothetical protein n=1 Tax=Caulobacter sp. BK020 TaxID=2512117 RepID=UPI00105194AD|nr:hypothetical protein [Caulobacter sp. BK020]TCS10465.1 hypothetical protein EV278_11747 [Caulobacter sp. BK020]